MPVPSTITDLSATAASNSPAATDAVFPDLDNYLRAHAALIRQGDAKASDIASATTTSIGAAAGRIVDVTGTTTITGFGTVAAGVWRIVRFTGALTITYNGSSLILPGAANITTAAGDSLIAVSLGSGNWYVAAFTRAAGDVVLLSATQTLANKTISGSSNTLSNIANASLTNSSVTIGSTSVALGATAATVAGLTLTTPTIASITNGGTVTVPTGTDTLVNLAGTQTLSNKTLAAAVGSASAPTHTFTGRTSDGVYSPASGQVAIATGGSERLLVTSDGLRVGGADYLSVQPTFRNRIINGGFDIWQRGTSQSTNSYGSADRWGLYIDAHTMQMGRAGSIKSGYELYVFRSAVSGSNNAAVYQRIEGLGQFSGKTVSVSFRARMESGSSKTFQVGLILNYGTGGSPTSEEIITAKNFTVTTTGQRFTETFTIGDLSGKTFGTNGNDYLEFDFLFPSAQGTFGVGAAFIVDEVQLEVGGVATPFENRPIGTEFALCQRYCEVGYLNVRRDSSFTGVEQTEWVTFQTPKRANPSSVTFSGGTLVNATDSVRSAYFNGFAWAVTPSAQGYEIVNRAYSVSTEL